MSDQQHIRWQEEGVTYSGRSNMLPDYECRQQGMHSTSQQGKGTYDLSVVSGMSHCRVDPVV
jgi:hypothetical protein